MTRITTFELTKRPRTPLIGPGIKLQYSKYFTDTCHVVYQINPYKPSVLFVGHRQTVQNQIRRRKTRLLIKFSTVCLQKFLLRYE